MKLVFQIMFALGFLLLALAIACRTWPAEKGIPSSRDTVTKCPHCGRDLSRSCVAEKTKDNITLICTACGHKYPVPNSAEQNKTMTRHDGRPVTESTESIDQLGSGDVLLFKRLCIRNTCIYYHSMLVTEVDRINNYVTGAELTSGWLSFFMVDIRNVTMKFEQLRSKTLVYRFLPLDCLPLQETLDRIRSWTEKGAAVWGKLYNPFSGNCQHLAMLCKTGQPLSEDSIFYLIFLLLICLDAIRNFSSAANKTFRSFELTCVSFIFPVLFITCKPLMLDSSEHARLYVINYVFIFAVVLLIFISRWLKLSESAEMYAFVSIFICAILLSIFMSWWLELSGDHILYAGLSIAICGLVLLFLMVELHKLRKDAEFYAVFSILVCALVFLIFISRRL